MSHRTTHLVFKPSRTRRTKKSKASSGLTVSSGSAPSASTTQTNHTAYRSSSYTSASDESTSATSDSDPEDIDLVETSADGRHRFSLGINETPGEGVNRIIFHGRSSTAGLVEATRRFKFLHLQESLKMDTREDRPTVKQEDDELKNVDILKVEGPDNSKVAMTRRPVFWKTSPWEHAFQKVTSSCPLEAIPHILAKLPQPDLCQTLIDLYFVHTNNYFPLLHRSIFERQWEERLYERNVWFAAVCFNVFAVASRWCEDERVLGEPQAEKDWTRAGWVYFDAAAEIHTMARSLIYPSTLFEIQSFSLMAMFLRGTSHGPTAWLVVSIGLRKAHDVGAHRKAVYQTEPNANDELWKRAFWLLLSFDRIAAVTLGRTVCLGEEDFDLDLPLEVDDEYWTGPNAWKQPDGVPSVITGFNQFVGLTQIMAFTIKTVYAVDRRKIFRGLIEGDWRVEIVSQLNAAIEVWLKNVPDHLKWSEDIPNPLFFTQSAMLHATYYLVRMHVYRHFIPAPPMFHSPMPGEREPTPPPPPPPQFPFPALAICISSARACTRIVEVQLRKGSFDYIQIPAFINALYVPAAILILALWDLKAQQKVLVKMKTAGILEAESTRDAEASQEIPHADAKTDGLLIALERKMRQLVAEVNMLLDALECVRPRWECVNNLLHRLKQSLPSEKDLQTDLGPVNPPDTFKQMTFHDLRRQRQQEQQEKMAQRKQPQQPADCDSKPRIELTHVPLSHWPPQNRGLASSSSQTGTEDIPLASGSDIIRLMQQHELHTFAEGEFESTSHESPIRIPSLPYDVSTAPHNADQGDFVASEISHGQHHPSHCRCPGCVPNNRNFQHHVSQSRLHPNASVAQPDFPSFSFNASPPFISSSMRRASGAMAANEYNTRGRDTFAMNSCPSAVEQVYDMQPFPIQGERSSQFEDRTHHPSFSPTGVHSTPSMALPRSSSINISQPWKTVQDGPWSRHASTGTPGHWQVSPSPTLHYELEYQQQHHLPGNIHDIRSNEPYSNILRRHSYGQAQSSSGREHDSMYTTRGT